MLFEVEIGRYSLYQLKVQLPKPRLRLEAASSSPWHRWSTTALTGQPAIPLGMCSLWLMSVTSIHFCPCLAAPASPAALLGLREPAQREFLPRLQVYGCESGNVRLRGASVPERRLLLCVIPLLLAAHPRPKALAEATAVAVGTSLFWYSAVGRVQVAKEETRARVKQFVHLAFCFGVCLAEKIWSFKKPQNCALKLKAVFHIFFCLYW